MAVGWLAGLAVTSPPALAMRDRRKGVDAGLGNEDHAATVAAVATVRSPSWHVLFAAETHPAATAVASNNLNLGAVDKHSACEASGGCHRSTDRAIDHIHTAAFAIEKNHAVREREQRVIRPHADILAGMKLGAHLANENVASLNSLASKPLYASSLRV